jgi:hypothetical protein
MIIGGRMQKGLVDIEALNRYFETRKDLAFAFLFGSCYLRDVGYQRA